MGILEGHGQSEIHFFRQFFSATSKNYKHKESVKNQASKSAESELQEIRKNP